MNTTLLFASAALLFAVGYLLSYQMHGKYSEERIDRLIEGFFNEYYASTLAHDTYELAMLYQKIDSKNVMQTDKEPLRNIITHNLDLMKASLKGGADGDSKTIDKYKKTIKIMREYEKT